MNVKIDGNYNITGKGSVTLTGADVNRVFYILEGKVTIKNINFSNGRTLSESGALIGNAGDLTLINTTLSNSKSSRNGGAIYNVGKLTVINATIANNKATIGGAIFIDKFSTSECNIKFQNVVFKDNEASGYNDHAGGAIYVFSTDLEVRDSTFNNCSANFAGAICSLNSEILISYSNFTNNLARYEGGAVYKMYGSGTVIKSNFTKNAALNGGALFSDNCTSFEIKNSEFASNAATGFGGAIFSNANPKLTVDGVIFTDNKDQLLNYS